MLIENSSTSSSSNLVQKNRIMPRGGHLYPLPTNLRFIFFYNVCATTLWFCCLGRFLILLPLVGRRFLPGGIADFFHVVAILPFVGFAIYKSMINTSISKKDFWPFFNSVKMIWICYGVIFPHPKIAKHTSYSLIIFSWCITYLINFSYYGFKVKTRRSPHWLFWAQYYNFFLTFPLAFTGELVIIFLSLGFVEPQWHEIFIKATLLGYIPIGYFMWGHLYDRKELKFDLVMEKRRQGRAAQNQRNSNDANQAPVVVNDAQQHPLRESTSRADA